jgi:hypothetical protein
LSRPIVALVALNVAWLVAASWFLMHRLREGGATRVEYVTNFVPVTASAPRPAPVTNLVRVSGTNAFRWAQLESEDYRTYVQRLRAIGCPEQTIRDIVIADVDKLLAPKVRAAGLQPRDLKYWEPVEHSLADDAAQREAVTRQRAVDFEKREVIRELLGVDLVGERLKLLGQDDYHGARLQFLPEDKRARVRLTLDQFSDREHALLEERIEAGDAQPWASAEMRKLAAAKEAALSALISGTEREQYDLWFSPAAANTRDAVFGMNATEDEFLKLYQLRREFDAKHAGTTPPPEVVAEFENRLRASLGDDRYGDYLRAQDPDFRALYATMHRFNLPPMLANELYGFKQAAEQQRAQVVADPNFTPAQKQAAQQAITEETRRAYREALGEKAFRAFTSQPGGQWLRGG